MYGRARLGVLERYEALAGCKRGSAALWFVWFRQLYRGVCDDTLYLSHCLSFLRWGLDGAIRNLLEEMPRLLVYVDTPV